MEVPEPLRLRNLLWYSKNGIPSGKFSNRLCSFGVMAEVTDSSIRPDSSNEGNHAVPCSGEGAGGVQHTLEHRREVQALVDAQAGLAQVVVVEAQPFQVGEAAQLRRYLTAQVVAVEAQRSQVGEAAQLRRYLTAQVVVVEVQPFQVGEAAQLRRYLPAQAGYSKERIFESTFVIPTRKRTKSNKKSAGAKQNVKRSTKQKVAEGKPTTGRPEKPLRRLEAESPDSPGSTAPKPANEETSKQDRQDPELLKKQQRGNRKGYRRRYMQERRKKAKELGECRDCNDRAIPGQTRCESCAGKHRLVRRANYYRRHTPEQPQRDETKRNED